MKRIDLFMPPLSQYGVLHHFTTKLFEALKRKGVDCRLLEAKKNNPAPFLEALFENPPECTLSFNGLLPDDQGRFFCDMIGIPHVACLVDSPNGYLPLTQSKLSILTCADASAVDFFKGLSFDRVLFMPHAVEPMGIPDFQSKREYDVVMLASCIDYEAIHSGWKEKYPYPLCKAMEEAVEIALADYTIPYYRAFAQAIDNQINHRTGLDPQKIDFMNVLDEIEMFIRGKDRVELVRAITEAKVTIFGSADGLTGWKKYLGNKRNVEIHDPIPFEQALTIMKHSKIVLNSCPWIKNGAHERIFAGLASGALVITHENLFLQKEFKDGESIVFYHHARLEKADHRINEYLANQAKREQVTEKGRQLVMKLHTWDQRAAQLIKELPPLLKKLGAVHK
jgi:spore maturation protein CgeB